MARVAQGKGDKSAAVAQFEEAARLQDGLSYTEPPYWYYPIRQSLAAALLQAGRHAEAKQQFELALRRAPANGWSYYGLAELHKARGDAAAARKAEADLAKTGIWRPQAAADFESLRESAGVFAWAPSSLRSAKPVSPVRRLALPYTRRRATGSRP